jgi:hypothetical protein
MSRRTALYGTITLVALMLTLMAGNWIVVAHGDETPTPGAGEVIALDYVPTYYEHIRPILEANCMNCHMEGEFGHDSFEMDTEEEILAGAEDIALVVSTGYMPAWSPGELSPAFLYDRSLEDQEIAEIVAWVEAGMPMGDAAAAPTPAPAPAEPVVEADIRLSLPEPYMPNNEVADDYRCFLMDPGFTQDTFVVGYDILPDNTGIVHHSVLFPATPAQRAEANSLNGADGKPGWECYGGTGLSAGGPDMGRLGPLLPIIRAVGGLGEMQYLLLQDDAVAQLEAVIAEADVDGTISATIERIGGTESLVNLLRQGLLANVTTENQPIAGVIGAWVPGSTPTQLPRGTGMLIPAGGFIIMQMHYNTQANDEPDQSSLILDITDQTDLRAARVLAINGPVEIPCPEGVEGEQCTREWALARSGANSDLLLAICGQSLEDYADQDPANAQSVCDVRVLTSGWTMAIMSHQHTRGRTTRTILNPDTPEERIMIDIPVWDFDWQGTYWFAEPIWLDVGDTIRVICTYDNSVSRQNPEPHYVVAGEGTDDEMCLNFITYLPGEPSSPMPLMTAPTGGE